MIYEKRFGTDNRKVTEYQKDAFWPSMEKEFFEAEKGDFTPNCQSESVSLCDTFVKTQHFKAKKPKKRRRLRAVTILVLLGIAVLFMFQARLFETHKLMSFINEVKTSLIRENEKPEKNIFSPVEGRTLYTVNYYNQEQTAMSSENFIGQQDKEVETYDNEVQAASAQQQEFGEVFSDGQRFLPITQLDLSGELLDLSNDTGLSPDISSLVQKTPVVMEGITVSDQPLVLVFHTHSGESYTQYEHMYPENEPTRSYEGENSVIEVGRTLCETLEDFGIPSIHIDTLHDKDSFINAYTNSSKTVKEYLEKYPSIRFVIDVHRDAIIRSDGESIKAVKEIAGEKYAQLMFVVGTNDGGYNHPQWQENLTLALNLQQKTEEFYPGLFRSINLRDVPFNQQLSQGCLLLEVGTSANLTEEALRSARAFGQGLAAFIYEG